MDNTSLPACKINIVDLQKAKRIGETWHIEFTPNNSNSQELYLVHIQGTIQKISGPDNDIIIIEDTSGKAKVTKGANVPGDLHWLQTGAGCSVIGTLLENGKLPHIVASKLSKVTNSFLQSMWPLEVAELKSLLSGKIALQIPH